MLTKQQIQDLNRSRIDQNNREKAEQFNAEVDADRHNGWASFTRRHAGQLAVTQQSVFYDCEANRELLERWILGKNLLISDRTIELAYQANRHRLAEHPALDKPYKRRTDTSQSRVSPQVRTFPPEPVRAPWTKRQILDFSKEQLSAAVHKYGLTEINRVLREQE